MISIIYCDSPIYCQISLKEFSTGMFLVNKNLFFLFIILTFTIWLCWTRTTEFKKQAIKGLLLTTIFAWLLCVVYFNSLFNIFTDSFSNLYLEIKFACMKLAENSIIFWIVTSTINLTTAVFKTVLLDLLNCIFLYLNFLINLFLTHTFLFLEVEKVLTVLPENELLIPNSLFINNINGEEVNTITGLDSYPFKSESWNEALEIFREHDSSRIPDLLKQAWSNGIGNDPVMEEFDTSSVTFTETGNFWERGEFDYTDAFVSSFMKGVNDVGIINYSLRTNDVMDTGNHEFVVPTYNSALSNSPLTNLDNDNIGYVLNNYQSQSVETQFSIADKWQNIAAWRSACKDFQNSGERVEIQSYPHFDSNVEYVNPELLNFSELLRNPISHLEYFKARYGTEQLQQIRNADHLPFDQYISPDMFQEIFQQNIERFNNNILTPEICQEVINDYAEHFKNFAPLDVSDMVFQNIHTFDQLYLTDVGISTFMLCCYKPLFQTLLICTTETGVSNLISSNGLYYLIQNNNLLANSDLINAIYNPANWVFARRAASLLLNQNPTYIKIFTAALYDTRNQKLFKWYRGKFANELSEKIKIFESRVIFEDNNA